MVRTDRTAPRQIAATARFTRNLMTDPHAVANWRDRRVEPHVFPRDEPAIGGRKPAELHQAGCGQRIDRATTAVPTIWRRGRR